MKRTVVAAALALVGAGLTVPTTAGAAVFAPSQSVLRDQAASGVIQVQRGDRGSRGSVSRPSRAAPARGNFRPSARPSGRSGGIARPGRPGRVARPGGPGFRPSAVRPGRPGGFRPGAVARPGGFRPGRPISGRHVRGFRPQGFRRWHNRHLIVRRWHHRPYYGRIIGGVAIGTLLAATAYYAYADAPPADGLCWFWADDDETQGYWDYCVD